MISLLIFIPLIFSIFAFRRNPILCLRNVAIAGVLLPFIVGTFLFPYSLRFDRLNVPNEALFELSFVKTMVITSLGLTSFILAIVLLDFLRKNSKINTTIHINIDRLIHKCINTLNIKVLTLFIVLIMLGSIPLFMVFHNTGYIPFCKLGFQISDKYFRGLSELYLPIRPFYTLGQHIMATAGFFVLLFVFSARKLWKALLLLLLYVIIFLCVLLTAKRGELVYPLIMLTGSLAITSKLKKFDLLKIALILFTVFYLVIILDPGNERPFSYKICNRIYNVLGIPFKEGKLFEEKLILDEKRWYKKNKWLKEKFIPPIRGIRITQSGTLKFFVDALGIQIRETTRLLYHFKDKNEKYLYGKTFFASALGLIPTAISPFKEKYYFGRVSQRLLDNNTETSGGPNVGLIGESFINFGYLGIIIFPFLIGIIVWYLDKLHIDIVQNNSLGGITTMGIFFFLLHQLVFMTFQVGSPTMQAFFVRLTIIGIILFFLSYNVKHKSLSTNSLHP